MGVVATILERNAGQILLTRERRNIAVVDVGGFNERNPFQAAQLFQWLQRFDFATVGEMQLP
jgi:hypothetical protein